MVAWPTLVLKICTKGLHQFTILVFTMKLIYSDLHKELKRGFREAIKSGMNMQLTMPNPCLIRVLPTAHRPTGYLLIIVLWKMFEHNVSR